RRISPDFVILFFEGSVSPRFLPSFPTRRSSDLRQHFVHGFLEHVEGVDFARRVTIGIRADRYKAEVPTVTGPLRRRAPAHAAEVDRKSTRLNSSHLGISYAVFCLKKKKICMKHR